ncbi:hypothetical protein [Dawidia soli]|uniref:Uncharacterized protein n=1 Tax=Dawidia soli TaxID=2782352 RepID=A0AAP2DEW6_9BACT|nr:hypothetical protein [Dawidia soli]MBT1689987.1 hypothetical protein [Dawidia soli]
MRTLLCLWLVLLLTACQSGRIPCPEPRAAKVKRSVIHKRFLDSDETLSAKAEDTKTHAKGGNKSSVRTISSVSVEEWDCPQPGRKKYMPRSVKQNIRKNMKKINAPESKRDSAAATVRP